MTRDHPLEGVSVEVTRKGVSRVRFRSKDHVPRSPSHRDRPALEEDALQQLADYFDGRRRSFELPLDLGTATEFRKAVLEELLRIPFGETVSYGELAARVGCGSARAVGQAVGSNPLPILIPCHRVVTANGRLGGFSSGLDRKVALLAVEGIATESADFSARLALRV